VLEVLEKRRGGKLPLAEARESIRGRLAAQKVQELARGRAEELHKQLADKKPGSPDEVQALAAGDPAVRFAVTAPFAPPDPVAGLGRAPAFNSAAFALPEHGVSEAVQVPRGWAVLWLQQILPPRTPQLAEVEDKVRQALVADKQSELARTRLAAARQQMAQGKSLDQVGADLGITAQESGEFGRDGSISGLGFNAELARQALGMRVGQVGGPVADPMGPVLFQVTERKTWNPQEFQAAKAQTRERLEREQVGRLVQSIIEQRRRDLGLRYNPSLLDALGITGEAPGSDQAS
jgi:hypothetical protein